MGTASLRLAREEDAAAIAEIYAPYVEKTSISFETVAPDSAEMARRLAEVLPHYPWLVCEQDGKIAGYAYAHAYGERAAYGWAAVSAVYIDEAARGKGLGRVLYRALEGLLAAQGVRSLYAHVTHPNPASDAFHLAMGYEKQGFFPAIGYKFGRPAGVTHYAKALLPVCENPPTPLAFARLDAAKTAAILQAAAE